MVEEGTNNRGRESDKPGSTIATAGAKLIPGRKLPISKDSLEKLQKELNKLRIDLEKQQEEDDDWCSSDDFIIPSEMMKRLVNSAGLFVGDNPTRTIDDIRIVMRMDMAPIDLLQKLLSVLQDWSKSATVISTPRKGDRRIRFKTANVVTKEDVDREVDIDMCSQLSGTTFAPDSSQLPGYYDTETFSQSQSHPQPSQPQPRYSLMQTAQLAPGAYGNKLTWTPNYTPAPSSSKNRSPLKPKFVDYNTPKPRTKNIFIDYATPQSQTAGPSSSKMTTFAFADMQSPDTYVHVDSTKKAKPVRRKSSAPKGH